MARLAKELDELDGHYDAVVVGSGYGGGVAASRLARAGLSVAVLERGREFVTGEFPARFPDLRHEFQVTGKRIKTGRPTALYDIRVGADMHVLVGCGVGGGSLINAGVALRPDARVFADSCWPASFAQDGLLGEGYARAARWLRPSAHDGALDLTKVKALRAAAKGLKGEFVAPPLAVSFKDNVNAAGIAQPACTLCGDCCGGCNVGAKNTVALTYLPDAVRHGAQIFTHAGVRHVEKTRGGVAGGRWRIHVAPLDDGKSADAAKNGAGLVTLTADTVVLSAGTLGSTEILLRSRDRGLALSDHLGRRFSANGDIIAFGYGADMPVNAVGVGHPAKVEVPPVGAAVSVQLEINDDDDLAASLCIQEGVLPSALAPVLPAIFIPNGRILGAFKSLVNGVYNGPFKHLQTFFAVSHDSAAGRLSLDGDRLALTWPGAADEPVYARLDAALSKLVSAAGGSYVKNPLAGTVMGRQPATAHPLGGCGIGEGPSGGVVNHKSQVFDAGKDVKPGDVHDGLYVVDGSIIPRSLGVNPLLTITALAERALMLMAQDHGWQFDDAPAKVTDPATPQAPGAFAPAD